MCVCVCVCVKLGVQSYVITLNLIYPAHKGLNKNMYRINNKKQSDIRLIVDWTSLQSTKSNDEYSPRLQPKVELSIQLKQRHCKQ